MITDKTAYNREYYKKRRQAIFDYLGNACASCGSHEDLDVDHKDRTKKSFNISKKLSVKNNKEELDKCQILCRACHRIKTGKEQEGFTHGTVYAWMKKRCRCPICGIEMRKAYDIKNAKRRKPR